jgi:hypothetical protein
MLSKLALPSDIKQGTHGHRVGLSENEYRRMFPLFPSKWFEYELQVQHICSGAANNGVMLHRATSKIGQRDKFHLKLVSMRLSMLNEWRSPYNSTWLHEQTLMPQATEDTTPNIYSLQQVDS